MFGIISPLSEASPEEGDLPLCRTSSDTRESTFGRWFDVKRAIVGCVKIKKAS